MDADRQAPGTARHYARVVRWEAGDGPEVAERKPREWGFSDQSE